MDLPNASLEAGAPAPDFELQDQHGVSVRLSEFRGRRRVLLVFYPLAFSGVCTGELGELGALTGDEDLAVLAVSVDSVFAQRVFADREGYGFPLLSDFWPHGEVARAYGVFDEKMGVAVRGTFLIDKAQVVRWKVVNPISEPRDLDAYRAALVETA
ncbi:MAG: redoxin domain-containing protein [Streptosporangiales bacterium]|nr:redoxin domain-containing protein [Streptosporangiales bacterium]